MSEGDPTAAPPSERRLDEDEQYRKLLDDADLVREFEGTLDHVRMEKAERLLAEEAALFKKMGDRGRLAKEFTRVRVMFDLVRDHVAGRYDARTRTIAAILVGLGYIVWPADIIPDFIPILGQLDDIAVVLLLWLMVRNDIKPYVEWRAEQDVEYFQIREDLFGKKK